MEKERLEGLIIDYIDGRLEEKEKALVERTLAEDKDAFKLYEQFREVMQVMDRSSKLEPSLKLKKGFDQLLKEQIAESKPTKTIFFAPVLFRAAAAIALVMAGVAIGYWINKNQQREEQLLVRQKQMEEQMEEIRSIMMAKLGNQQSASSRISAVSQVMEMASPDDEIVKVLVKTMNEDGNTNVRLAALEALSKFQSDPQVRKELVKALAKQKDPVVQIALIQLMVKMKEKGAVEDLKNIVNDDKSIDAVKDEAYSGLLKLS
jgi:hypothetical protein